MIKHHLAAFLMIAALSFVRNAPAQGAFTPGAYPYDPYYGYTDYSDPYALEEYYDFDYGYQDYGVDYDLDGYYEPPTWDWWYPGYNAWEPM